MGYDGKGKVRIEKKSETKKAWNLSGACEATGGAILEGFIDFEKEISVIVGRSSNGDIVSYIPVQNIHKNRAETNTTRFSWRLPAHIMILEGFDIFCAVKVSLEN